MVKNKLSCWRMMDYSDRSADNTRLRFMVSDGKWRTISQQQDGRLRNDTRPGFRQMKPKPAGAASRASGSWCHIQDAFWATITARELGRTSAMTPRYKRAEMATPNTRSRPLAHTTQPSGRQSHRPLIARQIRRLICRLPPKWNAEEAQSRLDWNGKGIR
jgi:hypothetical protein